MVFSFLDRLYNTEDDDDSKMVHFLPREAMLSVVYAVVVCLCVCLSVTLRYCIKTAKHRMMQTTSHDSPMTLVF